MTKYPEIIISKEMLISARELIKEVRVDRTQASLIDTLTGILGEFIFAEYLYGDWRQNRVGKNKGQINFSDICLSGLSSKYIRKKATNAYMKYFGGLRAANKIVMINIRMLNISRSFCGS